LGRLASFEKCYGGFSGSNYACVLADGRKLLLKCTNDQPQEDVAAQVAALLFLKRAPSAPPTCYPWPLAGGEGAGYLTMSTGSPTIILDFLDGGAADKALLRGGAAITERLFHGAGSALAKLHSVPLGSNAEMAATGIRDAGGPGRYPGKDPASCCFVGNQHKLVESFAREETIVGHPFLPLHAEQVPPLIGALHRHCHAAQFEET
jgi:hypothetical protein